MKVFQHDYVSLCYSIFRKFSFSHPPFIGNYSFIDYTYKQHIMYLCSNSKYLMTEWAILQGSVICNLRLCSKVLPDRQFVC